MTVFDKMRGTRIPDYYPTMYRDGFKPWVIIEAAHKSIIRQHEERQAAAQPEPMNVKFRVEVVKK